DESPVFLAPPRGPVADPFLTLEWPGIHGAWAVHRQRRRRAAGGDADCGRPHITVRLTGSKSPQRKTGRSPSPMRGTDSVRPTPLIANLKVEKFKRSKKGGKLEVRSGWSRRPGALSTYLPTSTL